MSYVYSKSGDFTAGVETTQLFGEIESDGSITSTVISVSADGDTVLIQFSSVLGGGEKTALDAVVAAHVPSDETTGTDISDAGVLYADSATGDLMWTPEGGSPVNLTVSTVTGQEVTSASTFTSSSTAFVLLPGMSLVVPADGRYIATFNTSCATGAGFFGTLCEATFYKNGSQLDNVIVGAGFESATFPMSMQTEATLTAGDIIEARARLTIGFFTSYSIFDRVLRLYKVGS